MPMPAPKLAYVGYRKRRLAEMVDWYSKVFGAEIVFQNPALVFLRHDEEHHRFAFADLSEIAPGVERDDRG